MFRSHVLASLNKLHKMRPLATQGGVWFGLCNRVNQASTVLFFRSVRADMYDQLLRQKTTSQRGLSVRRPFCGLCRQHLATQVDSICFQCGHAFHLACLERAGCLVFVAATPGEGVDASKPVSEQWQCYSCVAKNIVRALTPSLDNDVTQAPTSSLATSDRHSASQPAVTRSDVVDEITNRRVSGAKDFLSRYKSPASYLAIVHSMSQPVGLSKPVSDFEVTRHTSVFDLPSFGLKLAPDPLESHR